MHIKIKLENLIIWLMVILAVLNCHSVYNAGNIELHLEMLTEIFTLLLFILVIEKTKKKDCFFLFLFLIFQIPIVVFAFSLSDYVYVYIMKYIIFFILIYFINSSSKDFFAKFIVKYVKILAFLSLLSLFFYLFSTILNLIKPTGLYYLKWFPARFVKNFYGIYFEVSGGKYFKFKNSSIFSEAPIFAAHLCLALSLELFSKKKANKRKIFIFYVALISTFSTTAYIYILISLFGVIYTYYEKGKSAFLKIFFRVIQIGVLFTVVYFMFSILLNKKNAIGESFLVRSDDYFVAFKVIRNKPILGEGFGNVSFSRRYMSSKRIATGNFGQSSDFAALLSSGGLYFIQIYIFGFLGIYWKDKSKKNLVFIICLMYVFLVSRIGSTLLFLILIACGLQNFVKDLKLNVHCNV